MSDSIEFIKSEWIDIHHSRQQDWQILLLLIGNLTALIVKMEKDEGSYVIVLLITGLIIDLIGFYIAIAHMILFKSKLEKILLCENKLDFANSLGFDFNFKSARISVQQMIMLIYSLIFSVLSSWLIYRSSTCIFDPFVYFIVGFALFIGLSILCIYNEASLLRKLIVKPSKSNNCKKSGLIYYASNDQIYKCLLELNEKPLKLIAPSLFENESEWKEEEWSFKTIPKLVKPVLLNAMDNFQFSVADQNSKQEKHCHESTLEIYISNSPITVTHDNSDHVETSGIVIIPPGTPHFVSLTGVTYVFQVSLNSSKISNDKIIHHNN